MGKAGGEKDVLSQLSEAIVDNPRATIKELAEAVGISKATLHRMCGTRDNLEKLITERAAGAFRIIVAVANVDYDDYRMGLERLIEAQYGSMDLLRYAFTMQDSVDEADIAKYNEAMDTFFLKGQKAGAFRIDFSVQFLSDVFSSCIGGVTDGQRRGRLPTAGIEKNLVDFFLNGAHSG